ncbi:MAG: hypothetical protein AAF604_02735 [Acidobacteriota bacterium]
MRRTMGEQRPIDDQVRDFYLAEGLDDERLASLLAGARRRRRRRVLRLAAAAVVTAVVTSLLWWLPGSDRADAVAAEVLLNHQKNLDSDFEAASWTALDRGLDRLPFTLVRPRAPQNRLAGFELLGGRYCSIQAQLAAQVKLAGDGGRRATLYVTERSGALDGLDGKRRPQEGAVIDFWVQGDLFYALAIDQPAATSDPGST